MFENVFKGILNDTLIFDEEKDYITLYQGLSYFGSKKEKELIDFLKNKIYNKERKELQKEILDFFESNFNRIKFTSIWENPSIPIEFFKKHLSRIDWYAIERNDFNLEKRVRDKIKNTIYFDFKPLDILIK